jgi:hypothetical protein
MEHIDLMAKLNSFTCCSGVHELALRAVMELHKAGNGREAKCVACAMQTMDCPTIKAIEKELP